MGDEFAPLNLRARLASLQDRIAQARTQLEAHGAIGDHSDALTELVAEHDAIRGSLDGVATVTELHHSKASAQTDALEKSLHRWLESIEHKFNDPTPRKPSASV
ncbi:hypothetical protein DLM45_08240 [Hyphomicrobium methylovorum]|nr:hypothetical protein [Hyphomicrobium methylovorum]